MKTDREKLEHDEQEIETTDIRVQLEMVRTEVITLLPFLAGPYKGNMEACRKTLDEVIETLSN